MNEDEEKNEEEKVRHELRSETTEVRTNRGDSLKIHVKKIEIEVSKQ